jgi:hypothetical protein
MFIIKVNIREEKALIISSYNNTFKIVIIIIILKYILKYT